jgi:predicted transcriptional regulator
LLEGTESTLREAEIAAFVGDDLREMRRTTGLSVTQLAAALGCRERTIERWESEKMRPSASSRRRLAEALAAAQPDVEAA